MSKFTTHVVFSRVVFKVIVKTRMSRVSEQIAREGLVHASLDRVWESSCISLREVKIELRTKSSLSWTRVNARHALTIHIN